MMADPTELKATNAAFWNSNPCGGNFPTYQAFLDWMRSVEPYVFDVLDNHQWRGQRVLEVGCGQGTTLNYLPRLGVAQAVGIDLSAESVARCRQGADAMGWGDRIQVKTADAENLPFEDASFDSVISVGVLHHSPDTARGIREIHRVLKPGGLAIVMLYRSGNPKWWATRTCRAVSWALDRLTGEPYFLATRLRRRQEQGQPAGTALLELFGVPILNAFSNRQSRAMCREFAEVTIRNYSPGFERTVDILGFLKVIRGPLRWLDRHTVDAWGFYQVIEARKGPLTPR